MARAIGTSTVRPKYSPAMTNAKSSSPQIPVSAAADVSVVVRVRILQRSQLAAANVSRIRSIRHDCEPTCIAIIPVGPPNLAIALTCSAA
ncbi:MAG: hypothetical protein WB474_11595 [Nitrososphaeraceae archaeon]